MMPRILYLTPGCFDKGGISRYSRYQIRALREIYGHVNVRVISRLGPDEDKFEDEIDVYWHGSGRNDKIGFVSEVLKSVMKWRPEVVLSAHINYSGLAEFCKLLKPVTTVLNVYGVEVWSNPPVFAKFGLRNTDVIISDCNNTAEYVAKTYRKGARPHVVWDCVDLDKFKYSEDGFIELQRKYNLPDRRAVPSVLTLGRLAIDAAYKGYDRLIEVFATVLDTYPQAHLIVAGHGDLAPALKAKVDQLGIQTKVTFTGVVPEADLPVLYSYADIFSLITSAGMNKGEGLPLTPLEAMACNTPILVGDQDGSIEAVFDNENGFVVSPEDTEGQVRMISDLIRNPEKRHRMASRARELASIHFSFEGFLEKHRRIFSTIFHDRRA